MACVVLSDGICLENADAASTSQEVVTPATPQALFAPAGPEDRVASEAPPASVKNRPQDQDRAQDRAYDSFRIGFSSSNSK
jgi:hypothetical protein